MRRRTHTSLPEPRMEMAPLLDIIFLLLTFFIYSFVLTVRANVLPVNLPELTTADRAADADIVGITVDRTGRFHLNRKPITSSDLEAELARIGRSEKQPAVFLALDVTEGDVDRGPILIHMIELMRTHGIKKFNIVGAPKADAPPKPAS